VIRDIIISMRPRQWLKNTFVFAALVFSRSFTDPGAVLRSLTAFVIFSLLSGTVYLLNDLADVAEDRLHAGKRGRPIARGSLSRRAALSAALAAGAAALAGGFLINLQLGLLAAGYLLLMILYSLILKRVVIVDALAIAFGFIFRVTAGGVAIPVPVSEWLLICTFLLALFLALCKRRHELVLLGDGAAGHRKILAEYSPVLLDQMIAVVTSSTVMAYGLYTLWPRTRLEISPRLYYTIPFVLYGIFRYLYLVHRKEGGGEPGRTLMADRALLIDVVLWVAAVILVLRFFPPA
jgi:4-hydroxybenzoate polyprenyltransferase